MLRVLFANLGTPHCPGCRREVQAQSSQEIVDQVATLPATSDVDLLTCWQLHGHRRPAAELAFAGDVAAMAPDDRTCDGESQPGAAGIAAPRRIGSKERFEHAPEIMGGNAATGIGDGDLGPFAAAA